MANPMQNEHTQSESLGAETATNPRKSSSSSRKYKSKSEEMSETKETLNPLDSSKESSIEKTENISEHSRASSQQSTALYDQSRHYEVTKKFSSADSNKHQNSTDVTDNTKRLSSEIRESEVSKSYLRKLSNPKSEEYDDDKNKIRSPENPNPGRSNSINIRDSSVPRSGKKNSLSSQEESEQSNSPDATNKNYPEVHSNDISIRNSSTDSKRIEGNESEEMSLTSSTSRHIKNVTTVDESTELRNNLTLLPRKSDTLGTEDEKSKVESVQKFEINTVENPEFIRSVDEGLSNSSSIKMDDNRTEQYLENEIEIKASLAVQSEAERGPDSELFENELHESVNVKTSDESEKIVKGPVQQAEYETEAQEQTQGVENVGTDPSIPETKPDSEEEILKHGDSGIKSPSPPTQHDENELSLNEAITYSSADKKLSSTLKHETSGGAIEISQPKGAVENVDLINTSPSHLAQYNEAGLKGTQERISSSNEKTFDSTVQNEVSGKDLQCAVNSNIIKNFRESSGTSSELINFEIKTEKETEEAIEFSRLSSTENSKSISPPQMLNEKLPDNHLSIKREYEESTDVLDEIEAGKRINLQEAAAKRNELISKSAPPAVIQKQVQSGNSTAFQSPVAYHTKNGKEKVGNMKNKPVGKKVYVTTNNKDPEHKIQKSDCRSTSISEDNWDTEGQTSDSPRNKVVCKTEEDEIWLQEQLLATKRKDVLPSNRSTGFKFSKIPTSTKPRYSRREEHEDVLLQYSDSGEQKRLGMKSNINAKKSVISRRPSSAFARRKTLFSSSSRKSKAPNDKGRIETVPVVRANLDALHPEDAEDTTSTRNGSMTSEDMEKPDDRKRNVRSRAKLTFSRGEYIRRSDARLSPRSKKNLDVDTPISVTQAMQASMRKYQLERTIFQELLELKRLQIRAGKSNEQVLVKRLADNYRRAGLSINFREYDGPYSFRNFEKYLYDQLRLLQANRRLLPRFAPSDDLEKLSVALKKMNATKLPFLDDTERSLSPCDHNQCSHATHRCHHAAHAYTGVPCAAYIGRGRKNGFLPRVNPLKAPGPTQNDTLTRRTVSNNSTSADPAVTESAQTPSTGTQSPIVELEVQQGTNTQVFSLPTQSLDPSMNYYVSLSIKPSPSPTLSLPAVSSNFQENSALLDESGCISAPPPIEHNSIDMHVNIDSHQQQNIVHSNSIN